MTTLADVRTALANAVGVATDLNCLPYATSRMAAPMAYVNRLPTDPRMVLQQPTATYQFAVVILAPMTDPDSAQVQLDEYCELTGDRSVVAAIQDGANWPDGLVNYAQVTQIGGIQEVRTDTDGPFLAVQFDVEVVW